MRAQHSGGRFPERDLAPNESLVLSGITPTNNRVDPSNKQLKRMLKKQTQFVTEEALEKRAVSMFLHYYKAIGRWKAGCWKHIVGYCKTR